MSEFALRPERIAPDAVEDVRAVIRTAEWVRDEALEDPVEVAKITRGADIIHGWLEELLAADRKLCGRGHWYTDEGYGCPECEIERGMMSYDDGTDDRKEREDE